MKMTEAADLARLLGVPVADVMENAGIKPDERTIPLKGWIDGHHELHYEDSDERVTSPSPMPVGSFAIQYRTSGTGIEHIDGWTLFVRTPYGGVPPECLNKTCLVKLADGMQMVAFVKRGYRRGRFNLIFNASQNMNDVELEWAAPVIYIET